MQGIEQRNAVDSTPAPTCAAMTLTYHKHAIASNKMMKPKMAATMPSVAAMDEDRSAVSPFTVEPTSELIAMVARTWLPRFKRRNHGTIDPPCYCTADVEATHSAIDRFGAGRIFIHRVGEPPHAVALLVREVQIRWREFVGIPVGPESLKIVVGVDGAAPETHRRGPHQPRRFAGRQYSRARLARSESASGAMKRSRCASPSNSASGGGISPRCTRSWMRIQAASVARSLRSSPRASRSKPPSAAPPA